MQNIHIQQWDEDRFFHSKNEWNKLLKQSKSDQLFLSWEWQSTWWRTFNDADSMKLRIYVATTDDGTLVGIAPLYLTTVSTAKKFKTRRLQFIGNCWRGKSTMLTELLDFIVDGTRSEDVIRVLYEHIHSLKCWDELIIPFLNTKSETYQLLLNKNLLPNCYLRHAEKYDSYYLTLEGSFQNYTKNLGKNTRLKLINRRKLFDKLGDTSFERMLSSDINEKFRLLNDLHHKRWNKPVFEGKRLKFNKTVSSLLAERGGLSFSIISLNNKPISVQYNFIIDGHCYNIQSGFDEAFHKKISLGYLHFGYEIETSFAQQETTYDFLAGEGKNTQYKERLTNTCHAMTDLQIIRRPTLKMLYRLYDFLN